MEPKEIFEFLDSLQSKIVKSSLAESITENEIIALIVCKNRAKPQKPHIYTAFDNLERNGCPNCHKAKGQNEILYLGQKHCSVCGQAIDWSDDN